MRCVLISSSILFLVYLVVFLRIDATVIFILSIVNAMLATYIINPSMVSVFAMFKDLRDGLNFPQLMAAHEIFLAMGRMIGFTVIVLLPLVQRTMYMSC